MVKLCLVCFYRDLANIASDIIYDIGDYNLIDGNCQTFCDEFLLEVLGEGHNTYTKKFIQGAYVIGHVMIKPYKVREGVKELYEIIRS